MYCITVPSLCLSASHPQLVKHGLIECDAIWWKHVQCLILWTELQNMHGVKYS